MATQIVVISPYENLTKIIKAIIKEKREKIQVHTALLDEATQLCKKLENEGAKVFISRGGNTKYIRERIDSPVVDIVHHLGDYLEGLEKAKYLKGKIGIFCFEKKLDDIDTVAKLLNIDIKQYIFTNKVEAVKAVQEAKKEKIILGMGGILTGTICKEMGIEYYIVNTSKDSILRAIDTAKNVLKIQKEEEKKTEYYKIQMENYKAVLNFSYSGIIGIDEEYKINVFNPFAENLLNLSAKDVLGKKIYEVLPNTKLKRTLDEGKIESNKIMRVNNKILYTNRVPININNEIKGAVATFQDIEMIQENEREIRIKLHKKGLLAKYTFDDIIGNSKAIKHAIEIAKSYSKTSSTVLINGETGTGKEMFAQSIHNYSDRRSKPFVAINCAALPESILESELFGYDEGAFTGSKKGGKIGLFELAHGGTIFLDEVAEIPMNLQAQLLRVLQEKQIRRLGSEKIIPVDVRVIAATNKELIDEVKKDKFRKDLFYRLNILKLLLPPLRERKEDIKEIGISFIKKRNYKLYNENKSQFYKIFSYLERHNWYGNVRELENVLERIMVILNEGIYNFNSYKELLDKVLYIDSEALSDIVTSKISYEKDMIYDALLNANWNRNKAAKVLGISRTTLWRRMKKYNIGT